MRATSEADVALERFLDSLPSDRGFILRDLRKAILKNLPAGYVERFEGGMILYEIPLASYPNTYNRRPLMLAGLASQKSYVTLYLMAVYGDKSTEKWFKQAYAVSGKKLNMGKSCVHFKSREDIPADVIGQAIAQVPVDKYIEIYETARGRGGRK
ncbi:MAG: DUF1801 domain-containing protein [Chloroflexota bacterium]